MKIKVLQLNVWDGRMKGALTRFLREHDYDIVCFQEAVWSEENNTHLSHFVDTLEDLIEASGLSYDAHVANWGTPMNDGSATLSEGIAILSRWPITNVEKKIVHGNFSCATKFNIKDGAVDHAYYVLKTKLENGLTVETYHGYWKPDPMGDEETVNCMRQAADMLRDEQGPVLMCGDFNVIAESPAMRELDFLTDMTAETGTKQTLMNLKFVKDVACDHILVSKDIKWSDFEVHKELVSDHAAVSAIIEI